MRKDGYTLNGSNDRAGPAQMGSRSSHHPRLSRALTAIAFFTVAWIPRLHAIWRGFVTSDELAQIFDALRFAHALSEGRWIDTVSGNGARTMGAWAGALGMWWQRWRDAAGTEVHLEWVRRAAWFSPDNAELARHLAPFLPSARMTVAVVTALGVMAVYVFADRLWGRRTALIGAALLALDPFVVGRLGLLDSEALAMTFATLSLLAWLAALSSVSCLGTTQVRMTSGGVGHAPCPTEPARGRGGFTRILTIIRSEAGHAAVALISGLCAGWTILSGMPVSLVGSIIVVPTLTYLILSAQPSWSRIKRLVLVVLAWIAGTAAGIISLYPVAWVKPLDALRGLFTLSIVRTGATDLAGPNLGPLFSPLALLLRLTPITLVGLALSLLPLLTRWRSREANRLRAGLASLWVLVVGVSLVSALGLRHSDRNLLSAFPALDLLAGAGWMLVFRGIDYRLPRSVSSATVLTAIIAAQGAMALPSWPYYLDAYNPLLGGLESAMHTQTVGWGEGIEQIARYLNGQPGATEQVVATGEPATLAPLFQGQVIASAGLSPLLADKLLVTARDRQDAAEQVAQLVSGARLVRSVRAGGREIVWLYDTQFRAEEEHLARYGAPVDLILCDAPVPFVRRPGSWNINLVTSADEGQIVEDLNRWSASHTRLWYLSYSIASPITQEILRHQLDTYAARLDNVDLGYATATLYILPEGPAFTVSDRAFQPIRYGNEIALIGGALQRHASSEQGALHVQLRWKAIATPHTNYEAVVQLRDSSGSARTTGRETLLIDQRAWPTSYWTNGYIIEIGYALDLPPDLAPGEYQIAVGLVEADTGTPVPAVDRDGALSEAPTAILSVDVPMPTAGHSALLECHSGGGHDITEGALAGGWRRPPAIG